MKNLSFSYFSAHINDFLQIDYCPAVVYNSELLPSVAHLWIRTAIQNQIIEIGLLQASLKPPSVGPDGDIAADQVSILRPQPLQDRPETDEAVSL